MRHLLVLSLFTTVFLLLHAYAGEKLPADEEKLFRYATSRMNRRQWRDADRAFQAYLERHPEGQQLEVAAVGGPPLPGHPSRARRSSGERRPGVGEKWP